MLLVSFDATVTFRRYKDARIRLTFLEHKTLDDMGYEQVIRGSRPVHVILTSLYAGKLPSGIIRQALCELLRQCADILNIQTDKICLEASGDINGDYTALVRMYQRMSFKVAGIMFQEEEILHDNQITSVQQVGDGGNINDSNVQSVLMVTSLRELTGWCTKKYM